MSASAGYDAVVLAGGAARRLDGVDKAAVDIGGSSLLDRVLGSLVGAGRVVVVGPPRQLPPGVLGTREEPPGGGPVAGLAAGLRLVEAPLVVVLACDLPFLTEATVRRLLTVIGDAASAADGAQLVDETGRRQPLAAVYRTDALAAALTALPGVAGTPMRTAVAPLAMLGVDAPEGQACDCDTWADVELARRRADQNLVEET